MLKIAILGLVITVTLVSCSWFNFGRDTTTSSPVADDGTLPTPGISLSSAKDGKIIVKQANLEASGFLIAYRDNGKGASGKTVGVSAYLTKGSHSDYPIAVSELEQGVTYFVTIHNDNGDGRLIVSEDRPAVFKNQLVEATIEAN